MAGDGTVHGGFELSADGALRTLTSIRDRGAEGDAALKSLGDRMDSLATTSERMAGRVNTAWRNTSRTIDDQATQIETRVDRLELKLRGLGSVTATPTVNLQGVERANLQLSELEARLNRLSRSSSTPSVGGAGGGFSGLAAGGGAAAGGGGRSSRTLFGSLGGFGGIAAAGLGLSPGIVGLAVGATALAGSATGAALGAGTLGLGGAAPLAVGGGLTFAAAKPAITNLQNVTKAQSAYTQAVALYGRTSTQAATAQHALNVQVAANPAAAGAVRQVGLLRSAFNSATAPAQAQIDRGISGSAYNLRGALPALGRDSTVASNATANAAIAYTGFLTQPQTLGAIGTLTRAFASDLPPAEKALQNITTILEHLAVAATPFFHEAVLWADHWTAGLATASGNTERVQSRMSGYISEAKDWGRLTSAAYKTVRDILDAGAPSGDSMVTSLTHTLDRWDSWINNNPQKVQTFFHQAETTTSNIANAVSGLVSDIAQVANYLTPIFNRGMQFISLLSGMGPGGIGIGGSVLVGAYEGARNGRGPSAGSLAGAFVTGSAGPSRGRVGGGTTVGASAATTALSGRTGFLMPRPGFQTAVPASAAGVGEQNALFALLGGSTIARGARSTLGTVAATPENFGSKYGGIEGAHYAAPISELGAEASAISRFGGVVSGALGGIAKFALPVLAITSALQGAQTPGGIGNKVQGGLDAAIHMGSFGLLPSNTVQRILGSVPTGENFNSRSTQTALKGLGTQAANVRTPGQLKALNQQVQVTARLGFEMDPDQQAKMTAFLAQVSAVAAHNAGAVASSSWETAFEAAITRGEKPKKAIATMTAGMLTQLHDLGPKGAGAFALSTAAWVHQLEMDDPKLRGPLESLMNNIVGDVNSMHKTTTDRLSDLRDKTFFFNGQILTGVDQTWGAIRDSMVNKAQVAQEKLLGIWGTIQKEAVNSLTQMGFSQSQAKTIVAQTARGGQFAKNQSSIVNAKGATGVTISQGAANNPHARGGEIPGSGLLDTVSLGSGGTAAPGEAWIANRHTMNRLSSATLATEGKTAWQIIRDEDRPHSAPMHSLGGSIGSAISGITHAATAAGRSSVRAAHPELHAGVAQAVQDVLNRFPLTITSTTGGGHVANSYHYKGEAADISGSPSVMLSAANWIKSSGLAHGLTEGIHNPNLAVKYGQIENPPGVFGGVWAEHANHIHMAVAGALSAALGGGSGGGGAGAVGGRNINLRAPKSGLGGIPGAMADQAGALYAAGLQQKINAKVGSMGGGGISAAGFSGGGTSGQNQALGKRMMLAAGWGASQWPSLQALWTQESGWNANAVNSSSGAYGIPQALGHGHPYSLGDAPAQIAWGLNYIKGRYGSPAAAEAHERSNNWYQRGGAVKWAGWHARGGSFMTNGPTMFGAGEHTREKVTVTPLGHGGGNGANITVNMEHVYLGNGDKATLKRIGEEVAGEIIEALDRTHSGSSDRTMTGTGS